MIKHHNEKYIVAADEGILQQYSDALIELLAMPCTEEQTENLMWFLKDRMVVFCFASPELVVGRIMKRFEETGRLNMEHKFKKIQELIADQVSELNHKKAFIEKLEEMGVEVVHVNTADSSTSNINKITTAVGKWISNHEL